MTVDELIISVRVAAEGVKQGVAVAQTELKKLEKYTKDTQQINLKVNTKGIEQAQKELKALETEVKKLKKDINFSIKIQGIDELKKNLNTIKAEIASIQGQIKITVDETELLVLKENLQNLNNSKKILQEEIKLKTSISGVDEAKSQLNELNQQIKSLQKEVNIKVNIQEVGQSQSVGKNAGNDVSDTYIQSKSQDVPKAKQLNEKEIFTTNLSEDTSSSSPKIVGIASATIAGVAVSDIAVYVGLLSTAAGLLGKIADGYRESVEEQNALVQGQKDYNRLLEEGVTTENIFQYEKEAAELKKIGQEYSDLRESFLENPQGFRYDEYSTDKFEELEEKSFKYDIELASPRDFAENFQDSLAEIDAEYIKLTDKITVASIETADVMSENLQSIFGQKYEIESMQQLVDQFHGSAKGTDAWREANDALIRQFPYLQQNGVAQIGMIQDLIDIEDEAAKKRYENYKDKIEQEQDAAERTIDDANKSIKEQESIKKDIAEKGPIRKAGGQNDINKADAIIADQTKEIDSAKEKLIEIDAILPFISKDWEDITESMEPINPMLTEIQSSFDSFNTDAIAAGFDAIKTKSDETFWGMKANQEANIKAMQELPSNLALIEQTVGAEGDALVEHLKSMGVDAVDEINEIAYAAKVDPEAVKEYAKGFEEFPVAAQETANEVLEDTDYEIVGGIAVEKIATGAKESTALDDEVKTTVIDASVNAETAAASSGFENAGKVAVEQMAAGVYANKSVLDKAVADVMGGTSGGSLGSGTATPTPGGHGPGRNQDLDTRDNVIQETTISQNLIFDKRETRAGEVSDDAVLIKTENQINTVSNALWQQAAANIALEKTQEDLTDTQKEYNEVMEEYTSLQEEAFDNDMTRIEGMNTGVDATTDYAAITGELSKMLIEYGDNAEIVDQIQEEIVENTIARNKKIIDSEKEKMDAQLDGIDRDIQVEKSKDGMIDSSGNKNEFTIGEEISMVEDKISVVKGEISKLEGEISKTNEAILQKKAEIAELEAMGLDASLQYGDLEALQETLNYQNEAQNELLASKEEYYNDVEDLIIERQQKISDETERLIEEGIDAEVEAYKKGQKKKQEAIEAAYDAEIEALEKHGEDVEAEHDAQVEAINTASDAEIEAYQRRIDEIDELLKEQDREEKDNTDLDEIAALQDQIKYEKDDGNLYELNKELAEKQAEYEKRKAEEALLDEKDALNEKIDAVKESADAQIEIINNQKDQAIEACEMEKEAKIAAIEEAKEAAIAAMENETAKGEEELRTRLESDKNFRESKYKQAFENAVKEEELNQQTQQNMAAYLTSPELIQAYTNAGLLQGQAAGDAYAQAYKDKVANVEGLIPDMPEINAGSVETGAINDNTEEVNENSNAQMEILKEQTASTIEQYELAKKTRIAALEEQKEASIEASEEETDAEEKQFDERLDNTEDFYEEKDQMAWDSADYLRSEEVVGIYEDAGNLQGAAYQGAIQPYLDIIAEQIAALEARIAAANAESDHDDSDSGSSKMFSVSRFASAAMDNARRIGLGAIENVSAVNTSRNSYDQRTANITQNFSVSEGRLSPYQTKQAAKQALKLALK